MIYETCGPRPKQFKGRDAKAVVRQMHRSAWLIPPGKRDYMQEVAGRCEQLGYPGVDTSTHETFLASLVMLGFIRLLTD